MMNKTSISIKQDSGRETGPGGYVFVYTCGYTDVSMRLVILFINYCIIFHVKTVNLLLSYTVCVCINLEIWGWLGKSEMHGARKQEGQEKNLRHEMELQSTSVITPSGNPQLCT